MAVDYSKRGYIPMITGTRFYTAMNEINDLPAGASIYHYTTTSVLNAILKTAKFRATNVFYLNDYMEYTSGVAYLKKMFSGDSTITGYLDSIEKLNATSSGGVYSISFSGDADELHQWITYARECGVCIELDKDIIWEENSRLRLGEKTNEDIDCIISAPCFRKLIYIENEKDRDEKKQADQYKEVFAKYILEQHMNRPLTQEFKEGEIADCWNEYDEEARAFLMLLASYYKGKSFGEENEIRAVFLPLYESRECGAKISYFEHPYGMLRPYMEIAFYHSYIRGDYKLEIPLRSIRVGPGRDQEKVFYSIIHRLENGESNTWKYTPEELQKKYKEYLDVYFDKCGINSTNDRKAPTFAFLKTVKKYVDFDIYYHRTTFEIRCGERPTDTGYILFKGDEDATVKESFLDYQNDNYMTACGIMVTKSSISYIY